MEPALSAYHDLGTFAGLRKLYGVMSRRRQRQLHLVGVLMIAGALSEIAAIGAVLPFLSVLADPDGARQVPVFADALFLFGIETPDGVIAFSVALFCVAVLVAAVIRLWLTWSSQSFVFLLGHEIGVEIQRRVLAQSYSYHVATNTSETLATLEKTQILVFNVLLQVMLATTSTIIALFIVGALLWLDPVVAIAAALGFGSMYLVISLATRRRLHRASKMITTAYNDRIRITQESLGGIRDIIIDQSQPVFLREFADADRRLQRSRAMTAFIGAAPRFLIEAVGMMLIALLALALSRGEGFQAALPLLGALALGAQRLLPLIQQIYLGWTSVAGNRAVVGDVIKLLELPVRQEDLRDGTPLPFAEAIRFDDVTFHYAGRKEPALENIALTIPRGSRAALIGTTGSGKSTMVDMLMGLLEATEGRILVDGEELKDDARRAWQRNIAHVPQAIFLADTSIARNIAFGSDVDGLDQERLIAAARTAQIHDFIASLPEGYDTQVGERGVRLSGGQRQRLGIARALYKGAPVLILDEATSALDDATEAALMASLQGLSDAGLTVVMIAHRLSTVAQCDVVARLEHGRIVALGSYADVVGAKQAAG